MEGQGTNIERLRKRLGRRQNRRRLEVFLVCLLISVFIWFTRALSEDYSSVISISVEYKGLPAGLMVGNDLPDHLDVQVNTSGFSLFGQQVLNDNSPIVLDASDVAGPGAKSFGVQQLESLVRNRVNKTVSIESIQPESITLSIVRESSKKVSVKPVVDFQLDENRFLTKALITNPDSVMITGIDAAIGHITSIQTLPVDLGLKSTSDTILTKLDIPNDVLSEVDTVQVIIPIDEFTEKTLTIPVASRQLGNGFRLKTYPDRVSVSFKVGLNDYADVNESQFQVDVVINEDDDLNSMYRLPLVVTKQPEGIASVRLNPERVEFVLIQE